MQFLRTLSVALLLSLVAVVAHAEGWQNESFPAGPGKPELKYHVMVPAGVTITNKKGTVFKGGDVVIVPGKNVTVLESAYAKEQIKNPGFESGFINEQDYVGLSEEKVRDYAIVSVKVPDGVTVQGHGKTVTGPSQVTLIVTTKGSKATPNATPDVGWDTTGGWNNE